jgi:hypothetical protein
MESIMNNKQYELIGESIWDTYRNIAYIINEVGDTERGKDFIAKSAKKRKDQLDQADAAEEGGAIPDTTTKARLARGENQIVKVASNLAGRMYAEREGQSGDAGARKGTKAYYEARPKGLLRLRAPAEPTGRGTKRAVRDLKRQLPKRKR